VVKFLMPKAGLEPARVSPPPPQDGVSTKFHHFGSERHYIQAAWLWQPFWWGGGVKNDYGGPECFQGMGRQAFERRFRGKRSWLLVGFPC